MHVRRDEVGALIPATVWAMAVSLLILALLMQVFIESYGKAAVRASLDDGVRAGSGVDGSPIVCEERARERLQGLLGGTMGDGVRIACAELDGRAVAHADVQFPTSTFSVEAEAPKERRP